MAVRPEGLLNDTDPIAGAAPQSESSLPEAGGAARGVSVPVRLLIVDGQSMLTEGLRLLVEQQHDLEVVAHAATIRDAVSLTVEPDVVVTDIELPDSRGREVVITLHRRFSRAAILVLSFIRHPARIQDAVAAGAHGYLLKTAPSSDLIAGIRSVALGETYLQPSLGVALARWNRHGDESDGPGISRLSAKETEVLRLIARGHTNSEIATLLDISLRTVETHRAKLMQKLDRRTRAELVRAAQDAGLIDLV